MKLFEIEDEWTNKEETLQHLWRVQASKGHAFYVALSRAEPDMPYESNWTTRPSDTIDLGFFQDNNVRKKYLEMMLAKKAYEVAGGKYK